MRGMLSISDRCPFLPSFLPSFLPLLSRSLIALFINFPIASLVSLRRSPMDRIEVSSTLFSMLGGCKWNKGHCFQSQMSISSSNVTPWSSTHEYLHGFYQVCECVFAEGWYQEIGQRGEKQRGVSQYWVLTHKWEKSHEEDEEDVRETTVGWEARFAERGRDGDRLSQVTFVKVCLTVIPGLPAKLF